MPIRLNPALPTCYHNLAMPELWPNIDDDFFARVTNLHLSRDSALRGQMAVMAWSLSSQGQIKNQNLRVSFLGHVSRIQNEHTDLNAMARVAYKLMVDLPFVDHKTFMLPVWARMKKQLSRIHGVDKILQHLDPPITMLPKDTCTVLMKMYLFRPFLMTAQLIDKVYYFNGVVNVEMHNSEMPRPAEAINFFVID